MSGTIIREAIADDYDFVVNLMTSTLDEFYSGDHEKHASRIFMAHLNGGQDSLGFFSTRQLMFIAETNRQKSGMVHVVEKRQGTVKISPLIVEESFRFGKNIGKLLLEKAIAFAKETNARQIYCTVAQQNTSAYNFFIKNGFISAGSSDSHYKIGSTEVMLYLPIQNNNFKKDFDRQHITVSPLEDNDKEQVKNFLIQHLSQYFIGIDKNWVKALFDGYERRHTMDVNAKYKLIYVAKNRQNEIRGVVGATPKKGLPIKLMPFVAIDSAAFSAILNDIPYELLSYGHKVYIHLHPTPSEIIFLQQEGWKLDSVMPQAYHEEIFTQQWSLEIHPSIIHKPMRVKHVFIEYIKNNEKIYEVRVGYDNIKKIRKGDVLEFKSSNDKVFCEVEEILVYENIEQILKNIDYKNIIPHNDLAYTRSLLHEIYPPEKECLGMYVFKIKKLIFH